MRVENTTTSKHEKFVDQYRNDVLFRNSIETLKRCKDSKEKESTAIELISQLCKVISDCQEQIVKFTISASVEQVKYVSTLPGTKYMTEGLFDEDKPRPR